MTAWEILIANSTAPAGSTAWVHLNSQSGGGTVIIGAEHSANLQQLMTATIEQELTVGLFNNPLTSNSEQVLTAEIDQDVLEAEVWH